MSVHHNRSGSSAVTCVRPGRCGWRAAVGPGPLPLARDPDQPGRGDQAGDPFPPAPGSEAETEVAVRAGSACSRPTAAGSGGRSGPPGTAPDPSLAIGRCPQPPRQGLHALIDIGPAHPPALTRLTDPRVQGDLRDGVSRDRTNSTARRRSSGGLAADIRTLPPRRSSPRIRCPAKRVKLPWRPGSNDPGHHKKSRSVSKHDRYPKRATERRQPIRPLPNMKRCDVQPAEWPAPQRSASTPGPQSGAKCPRRKA
jgi:hypothetical protein